VQTFPFLPAMAAELVQHIKDMDCIACMFNLSSLITTLLGLQL